MSARNRRGLCTYCGKEKKLTADHVPPKSFLEQPFPRNLITVPACSDCNEAFKLDDEYTRTVLAFDMRANWNYAAQSNFPAVIRSLQRPNARGFVEYLSQQSHTMKVLTSSGQPMTAIQTDRQRVNASGMHILRGLYFHETGKRLSDATADVRIGSKVGLTAEHPDMLIIAQTFNRFPDKRYGVMGSAFSYAAAFAHGKSVWLMLLYDYFFWMGTVDAGDQSLRQKSNSPF